jgi:hypothetical protein
VMAAFPAAANSGQYLLTGASISSRPWLHNRAAHSATSALPTENTLTSVSRSHGRLPTGPTQPPQRSATTRPRATTHTAAPISPLSAKLALNASRTCPKDRSQLPVTVTGPAPGAPAPVLIAQP